MRQLFGYMIATAMLAIPLGAQPSNEKVDLTGRMFG